MSSFHYYNAEHLSITYLRIRVKELGNENKIRFVPIVYNFK